jgi:hypothetical protein
MIRKTKDKKEGFEKEKLIYEKTYDIEKPFQKETDLFSGCSGR